MLCPNSVDCTCVVAVCYGSIPCFYWPHRFRKGSNSCAWVEDYLSSIDNADSIPGETQHSEKKVEYRTISENEGNSGNNSDNLENQISDLQCELNNMRSDRYVMFGHDMTWKEHLEWILQILTESQSVDRGPGSGQEKPSKGRAAKC